MNKKEKSNIWNSKDNEENFKKFEPPKIEKLDFKTLVKVQDGKKKSLFAQNLERQGKLKDFYDLKNIHQVNHLAQVEQIQQIEKKVTKSAAPDSTNSPLSKQLITGEGVGNRTDVQQIHLENLERLAQMKPDEILNEQQKIIQQLDPKIVSFIRKKQSSTALPSQQATPTGLTQVEDKSKEEFLSQLPIKPDKKWLHMDKIEYDKLEWMIKAKPVVKTDSNAPLPARFNFQGDVMKEGEEVPVTAALHHHGSEPDAAGYSLDELFHLARSNFNQQRVIALQTLANILGKCHTGVYFEIIKMGSFAQETDQPADEDKHNLLNQLVDGGILFLLRWSLDDQTESIINAALNGLKNLLQPLDQEDLLDVTFDLYKGHEMFALHPFPNEELDDLKEENTKQLLKLDQNMNVNEKKKLDELTDEEYIKYDLVKGLFRMNLIARLYYLLKSYKPNFTADVMIKNIFQIVYRCLRHSPQISHDLAEKYADFLDLIVSTCLPKFITDDLDESRQPASLINHATMTLKMLRLIAGSSARLAAEMFKKYDLNNYLISYLSIMNSSSPQLTQLQVEAVRLIRTFNMLAPKETRIHELISNSFEFLIKHVNCQINKLTRAGDSLDCDGNTIYLQALIALFGSLANDGGDQLEICSSIFSIIHTFFFNKFEGVFKYSTSKPDAGLLNLMSVCLGFFATFLDKTKALDKRLELVDRLNADLFAQVLENDAIQMRLDSFIMSKLLSSSTATQDDNAIKSFKQIKANNLSYLPTMLCSHKPLQLEQIAPFAFLSELLRVYNICFKSRIKVYAARNFQTTRQFLNNAYLKSFLKAYSNNTDQGSDSLNNSCLTMKYENCFVYNCLKMAFNVFKFEVFFLILLNFYDSNIY